MGEIGRWNRHRFVVSSEVIRSFDNLNITASSETEDKESDKQKYVSYKNAKPTQITIDVRLSAQLGCDVRTEAMGMVEDASKGVSDYFYVGKEKLVSCQLMLTDTNVTEVGVTYDGTWSQATVKMTFKQSTKADGSLASSMGGGNKKAVKDLTKSVKKDAEKTQPMTSNIDLYPVVNTIVSNYYMTEEEKKAQQARQTAQSIINKAKTISATSATSSTNDVMTPDISKTKIVKYKKAD